jgi:DNA-binding NarL/FixJ family response regulator
VPRTNQRNEGSGDAPTGEELGRLTNLVALLLVKGEPQPEQVSTLTRAGYPNKEIARLLGLTPNAVNIAVHRLRKRR